MEMYIGRTCPLCNERLNYHDAVVMCSECNAFHHEKCWNENHGCTTYECLGNARKVSGVTVGRDTDTTAPQQPSNKIFCSRCGTENIKGSSYCNKCGSSLSSGSASYSQSHNYDSHDYNNNYSHYGNYSHYDEGLDTGEKVGICLGNICLSPLLGIILYFVWKNDKPKKADDVCVITLLSLIGPFILAFIFGILGR